jgi:hypothetical protein
MQPHVLHACLAHICIVADCQLYRHVSLDEKLEDVVR